jgi:hypothetical protein
MHTPRVCTDQAVPVDLQLGSGTYIPWYKAYWIAPTRTSRLTQVAHCCKQGDTSAPGLVGKGSLTASIWY